MQIAFLMIITLAAIIYAFVTKQNKLGLGLLVLLVSLFLQIPNLATGFWVDVLTALSLIIFALALFVIVYQKKKIEIPASSLPVEEEKKENEEE